MSNSTKSSRRLSEDTATRVYRFAVCAFALLVGDVYAAQMVIAGPPGSSLFGTSVTTLPNGNIVVTDPFFDLPNPAVSDIGAVYLYRPTGTLISTLRGSAENDRVGVGGIVVLANGNFVVRSPEWNNGSIPAAGAVTFCSASSGINGQVSSANSLVGSSANDAVGNTGVTALTNGNYVVATARWSNGAGAVTFGSGTIGVAGVVSASNSLVGVPFDQVGSLGVTGLPNGNYVIRSPFWGSDDQGAVTFGNGLTGIVGLVSAENSLVGSSSFDNIGIEEITVLANGNYVVASPDWNNGFIGDVGAVTFGSGTLGVRGPISSDNSLIGSSFRDQVGAAGVTALTNGNYVVRSISWDNGSLTDVGAVTFGSGTQGIRGTISAANSLIGTGVADAIGSSGVTALANGNYVVGSAAWDNGAIPDAGAVTFGSGVVGIVGTVSQTNSLVGATANENLGSFVTPLSNGNYVVANSRWDNGSVADVGAVAFGSGSVGVAGPMSASNSLIGSVANDQVGIGGVTALTNGNYVVRSFAWRNGAIANAGAITFASGATGITGVVSPVNSLVGEATEHVLGSHGVTALSNGNYVINSPYWDNGAIANVGAVTFASGTTGIVGVVSPSNSLVGSKVNDYIGGLGVTALPNGDYVVQSTAWDNGPIGDVGSVTLGNGTTGISGVVSPLNSIIGTIANDSVGDAGIVPMPNGNFVVKSRNWSNIFNATGAITLGLANGSVVGQINDTHSVLGLVPGEGAVQVFSYDPLRNQLAVGQRASNRVVLHRTGVATSTIITGDSPDPSTVGQPVMFTARVSASPRPTTGQVRFMANSGETCIDSTPSPVTLDTIEFACTITFDTAGIAIVLAEYIGSIAHAYSGSAPAMHTTIGDAVFENGFEGP